VVVANADDPLVMSHVGTFTGRRVTFGESPAADIRASQVVDRGFDGTTAEIVTPVGRAQFTVPLAGRAQLSNVLAATAVALEFKIPLEDVVARVKTLAPVARRGAITALPSGARLVDDSYNASPAAVSMMLAALAATPTSGRRIAVLGEMLELGKGSVTGHREVGTAAAATVDLLIVVGGGNASLIAAGAKAAGLDASRILEARDRDAALDLLRARLRDGDVVLVKASRGVELDVLVDALRAELSR